MSGVGARGAASNEGPTLSIIIPVFQEGTHLEEVLRQVAHHAGTTGESFELILIDDGSHDSTWEVIGAQAKRHPQLRGIRLSRNFGKEAAVCAGLDAALGRAVVVMDGDLQHPPEMLPEMVALWRAGGVDLVEAVKERRGAESFVNRIGSRLFYSILQFLAGHDLHDASDFKLMDRRVVEAWMRMGERNLFFRGMVSWLGFKRAKLQFTVPDRVGGHSGWTFFKLLKLAVTAVTAHSSSPLQIVTFLGTLFFFFAAALGAQTLYNWFSGSAVSGFTTVILLVLIVGGVQMICLGIFGTYIARIYEEVKGRPRYVVKDRIGP
jgi:glycosyltransferase involved in cell wall biosynthesis